MSCLVGFGFFGAFFFLSFRVSDQLRGSLTADNGKKPQQDMLFGRRSPDCSIKEPITGGNGRGRTAGVGNEGSGTTCSGTLQQEVEVKKGRRQRRRGGGVTVGEEPTCE